MRWDARFAVGVGAMFVVGCGGGVSFVNMNVEGCNAGRPGWCQSHADDLVGDSLMSKIDDETGSLRRDPATAKKLYAWECRAGNGFSCRAIVEKKLAASPAEEEQYTYLAEYYGMPVRSPEAIRAERALTNKQAAEFNAEKRAAERRREEESRQNWKEAMGMAGQALTDWSAQISSKYGNGAPASGPNVGGAVPGSFAVNPDPCAPCKKALDDQTAACGLGVKDERTAQGKSQSPTCYRKTAAVHRCTVSANGCSKNPGWSIEEAKRMDRAAQDIQR